MHDFLKGYYQKMADAIVLTDDLQNNVLASIELLQNLSGNKSFIIGNGGSAGIASHLALDFTKNADVPMLCFNDSAFLTAISNDYGYEYVFEKGIEYFGSDGDVLLAISSSGSSENIIRACTMARQKNMKIITFSGKSPDNPLRTMGDINFYVDSHAYNIIESSHQVFLMSILDAIIGDDTYTVGLPS